MKPKYDKINWKNVQSDYNNGMTQNEILKKYSISRTVIESGVKAGLFIKDKNRRYGHKHSEKTKNILSNKRREFLKNNPDLHPWKKHSKFQSEPCEKFKQLLLNKNISFVPEFTDKEWIHNYSIDIAFPNNKVGIEINGNQHYTKDGQLVDYYKRREFYLTSIGWKIYQIHYSLVYNKNIIDTIIIDILNKIDKIDYSSYVFKSQINYCTKCGKKLKRDSSSELCQKCNKTLKDQLKIEKRKQIVLSSNIDFSKFGWMNKLSKLFEISPQKISGWMKKYMPEYYKEKCFIKKQNL